MKPTSRNKAYFAVKDIVLISMMTAVLESAKIALSFLPNIELVTLLIVLYARFFGRKVYFVIPLFVVIETFIWGLNLWVIMYLYVWFVLAVFARIFQKQSSVVFWAAATGGFGLVFGALCSVVYLFIGGWTMAFAWWISGIPFDFLHCAGNTVLTLVLFKPLDRLFGKLINSTEKVRIE